jgi:DNA anti-recombination protein RmuC
MALAAIRKRNYRHFMSLFAVVPHTKEHIQKNNHNYQQFTASRKIRRNEKFRHPSAADTHLRLIDAC